MRVASVKSKASFSTKLRIVFRVSLIVLSLANALNRVLLSIIWVFDTGFFNSPGLILLSDENLTKV